MHGNPLIRVLVLTAALAVMAIAVSSMTRASRTPTTPASQAADPGSSTSGAMRPAQLTVQFSAPARSLGIRAGDARTILVPPHPPEGTEDEFRFALPIANHAATLIFDVIWETPAPNRFLRLVLEADSLPTRELTIHAPDDLEDHAVTFTWPPNPDSESP